MSGRLLNESVRFFIINGLTAFSFTFAMPIIPLFLIDVLGIEPVYIGVFTVATALSGILVSRKVGNLSDSGSNDRVIYAVTVGATVLAGLAFAALDSFWQAMLAGVILMAVARASMPQCLAMIRKYANCKGKDSTKFNAQMRSAISLVWVVGPPVAFAVAAQWGFDACFLISAVIACVVLILAYFWLPDTTSVAQEAASKAASAKMPLSIWLLGGVTFFACMANSLYVTAMPIYVTKELGLDISLPGVLLGLAAGLEIPLMLFAGWSASRFGSLRLILIAFVNAALFYLLVQWATTPLQLMGIQVFNGVFFGIFIGLAVSLFQDALPTRSGAASAFYSNAMTVGSMVGGSVAGVVAQWWSFKSALLVSLFLIFLAMAGLVLYAKQRSCAIEMAA
ncbi:sugar efflux transporter [Thaumasiovibrio subtropicus]|uniref:sugar efflux transporter n=1 Tax=Thaumasiovibrio subtropicus TaxID=1891207 RepID=UPI00131CFF3D|nr:sugar efflux transporter [Thaumasiovibrio subtropicus]